MAVWAGGHGESGQAADRLDDPSTEEWVAERNSIRIQRRLGKEHPNTQKNNSENRTCGFEPDHSHLRANIIRSLRIQGFQVHKDTILPPKELSKDKVRALHKTAVQHRIQRSKDGLRHKEKLLLRYIASGSEVDPSKIAPCLVEVFPDTEDELLFRYASLHWSIPVSSGYGRRIRFLVMDDHNRRLIGLIGIGDPVFSLKPRDEWVGWTIADRRKRLRNVMDAFVLGAVPPYSMLLCGKLVAMLAATDIIRQAFKRKYQGVRSVISREPHDGRLAMITTTSALGRSSVYNRLRFQNRTLYESVGFTKGSGEFQFLNGLYATISRFARDRFEPTAKHTRWGTGFRNRREVVKKTLPALGLSSNCVYHGIAREVFVIPLARNTREFLRREHTHLRWYHQSEAQIMEYFQDRWLLPRAARDCRYRQFDPATYRLWHDDEKGTK